jgi:hypothetical protein
LIAASVRAKLAFADGRLDAKYHCSPGVLARERMLLLEAAGADLRPIAGSGGLGSISPTTRTKRVYAALGEESVPYLRPYDIFDYLPQAADLLSKTGSAGLEELVPEVGTILQTCSGRNLGPLAYADSYIRRFAVSDDMLRLNIPQEAERLYTLAFLSTPTGQALLKRNKTGNVIDHLAAADLASIEVPFIDDALTADIAEKMRGAIAVREAARERLSTLISHAEAALSMPSRESSLRTGWTQQAAKLEDRLDAAFYDPYVATVRDRIMAVGGRPMAEVAEAFMLGQYKRYYVAEGHGKPVLSGRQLLQLRPINLQYVAARSLDFEAYKLGRGMIVFGARGRAEERLGLPALVTEDRSDWLASHNVVRVLPKPGVDSGWLYLCMATWHVQIQVKASAFGSVIDVVTPAELESVALPPVSEDDGAAASQCWNDFATAATSETEAVKLLERALLERTGVADLEN